MVPASAGRREPKKILHSELQGCDICTIFAVNWVSSAGPVEMLNAGGGSPFAGGKMLNAGGGPPFHGGGGFKMTLVL